MYKCRVDFSRAPTRIANINLRVIVPSEKPRIFTSIDNREVRYLARTLFMYNFLH